MTRRLAYELYLALDRMSEVSTAKVGYAIAKTKSNLILEAGRYQHGRNQLLKKYGTDDDGRYSINVKDPAWRDFADEFLKVENEVVDVNICTVKGLKMEDLVAEGVKAKDYALVLHYLGDDSKPANPDGEKTYES